MTAKSPRVAEGSRRVKQPPPPVTKFPTTPAPQPVRAMPIETPGTQMPMRPPGFRSDRSERPLPTPSGLPLESVGQDFGEWAGQLKELMQERHKALAPEDRGAYFWQGFEAYPEQMAQMIVRRAWTNRMMAQGPVAEWMAWVNERMGGRG